MTKVYGYLRVSSEEQAKSGNGLSGQQGAIQDFCAKEQFEIVKFYSDGGVSGKYSSRKALDEMLKDLKLENKNPLKPEITYVIVDDIDRLARDVEVRFTKKREIETTGARVLSLKQQLDDSPEANLMSTISMATKQYERENGGRRVQSRQEQRMKDGYRCFQVPLGYKFEKAKNGHGKVVVPDEPAFSVIRDGLKKLANGILLTQEAFCEFIMNNGIRSKKGCKIYKSFARHLLNPEHLALYAGLIHYPKRGLEMLPGKHESAITEYEFNKLVQKFKIKGFYKEYEQSYITEKLPLRQIVCCGCCGHPLTGAPSKGHGGIYFYYTCNNKNCEMYKKSFKNDKVHEGIANMLNGLTIDEKLIDAITFLVKYYREEMQGEKQTANKQIEMEKNKVDSEMEKFLELIVSTTVDKVRAVYEKRIAELEIKSKELELKLQEQEEYKGKTFDENLEEIIELVKNPLNIWNNDDVGLKKILITSLFEDGLMYSRDKGVRTSKLSSAYLPSLDIGKNSEIRKKGDVRTSLFPNSELDKFYPTAMLLQMVGDIGLEPMTPCL